MPPSIPAHHGMAGLHCDTAEKETARKAFTPGARVRLDWSSAFSLLRPWVAVTKSGSLGQLQVALAFKVFKTPKQAKHGSTLL